MKKIFITLWLSAIFVVIGCLFWYNDYKYNLPTPVPVNYQQVPIGSRIQLHPAIKMEENKPVMLHFFNPDCPCSKFNIQHIKKLVKQYGKQVNFVVVLSDQKLNSAEVKRKLELPITVITDPIMSKKCGIYSTPQAVIIDTESKLYYRGNYNSSRYCSNQKTEYARIALENILNHKPLREMGSQALIAYGCSLPTNLK